MSFTIHWSATHWSTHEISTAKVYHEDPINLLSVIRPICSLAQLNDRCPDYSLHKYLNNFANTVLASKI